MSKAKGIPLAHAHRILQGQTTLNDVLKLLMRKDRFERLVRREGLDPSLAGQVASGHLTRERAQLVTRIRKHRNRPLDHDPLRAAFKRGGELALWLFGEGWVRGSLVGHKVYEVELLEAGAEGPRAIPKHEVKAVADPAGADAVAALAGRDEAVAAEGLGSTQDRAERIRPSDDWLLAAAEGGGDVTFVFRDGSVLTGRLMSFGRWDASLEVEISGAAEGDEPARVPVEIFFHSLHKSTLERA